jgi:hypothetical protein
MQDLYAGTESCAFQIVKQDDVWIVLRTVSLNVMRNYPNCGVLRGDKTIIATTTAMLLGKYVVVVPGPRRRTDFEPRKGRWDIVS